MGTRTVRGGPGSNQYQQRAASAPAIDPDRLRDVRAAVQSEEVAWAFADGDLDALDQSMKSARRVRKPEAVSRFAAHPSESVRLATARRKTCPPEVLLVLSHDESKRVRAAVYANPNCPQDAFMHGATTEDETETVRALVDNPSCPPEALAALYKQQDGWWKRAAAVAHPNCPPGLVKDCWERGELQYRRGVLRNPNCPIEYLRAALNGSRVELAQTAITHPALPNDEAWDRIGRTPYQVGSPMERWFTKRDDCTAEQLDTLARDHSTMRPRDVPTRIQIARHRNTWPSTLAFLASDDWDPKVIEPVMRNPNCPTETLRDTTRYHNQRIKDVATKKLAARERTDG